MVDNFELAVVELNSSSEINNKVHPLMVFC